ncbi:MAG: ribonuclease III [Robiginitomaculum sp.]|nr:ribonuclease III [Robiginitomaculum sp.]
MAANENNKTDISPQMLKRLAGLETEIRLVFKDKHLIVKALTHPSYGDGRSKDPNYERLEFLGDRVLGLLTAERLFVLDTGNEGSMARRLNALVRKEACARVARRIDLGSYLLMSPSEVRQGGRDKTSILGDACEALLAAIYLDGGLESADKFYNEFWREELENVFKKNNKDPKTELQEKASASGYGLPEYSVAGRTGPDHRPLFVIEVDVPGLGAAKGTGKSKKDAERYAAQHLLENWPK